MSNYSILGIKRFPFIFLYFVAFGLGCSQGGDSSNVEGKDPVQQDDPQSQKPADGQVNGNAWSFQQGRAVYRERPGFAYYEIRLWDQVFENPCEVIRGSGRQIRLHVEPRTAQWKLEDYGPFAVFPVLIFSDYFQTVKPADNLVAERGLIDIKTITKTSVSGFVRGQFELPSGEGLSFIDGQFEVTMCPHLSSKPPSALEVGPGLTEI